MSDRPAAYLGAVAGSALWTWATGSPLPGAALGAAVGLLALWAWFRWQARSSRRCQSVDQLGALLGVASRCELPRGHHGRHRKGSRSWWEASAGWN